ncbi:hypothetical protein PASE110613_03125 [Paenibacillus sediminis]|uniref:DUF4190 domain-containing protein n=1 Tax=Paenibacillus sediminis TaxID=664909 RepID=A0ABS4GYR7_9BACL|nr:hypothetical protein [Paenibacillus sediminis]MBP1935419.1 hypothetical protein [Paenibacillus sediminis]
MSEEHNEHEERDNPKNDRIDYPRKEHREEYGAEIAAPVEHREVADTEERDVGRGIVAGYIGLAIGILSLFMWSIVLGPVAAALGYYAYSEGYRSTGAWSIGLGIVATLSYFFLVPFVGG